MIAKILSLGIVAIGTGVLLVSSWAPTQQPEPVNTSAAEIVGIQEWINSKPLKLADLKGKVVVLHFWTFG